MAGPGIHVLCLANICASEVHPVFNHVELLVLDPFPTKLLMSHLSYILDIILCIVNLCFSSGVFPTPCKSSIIFPLIKKQGLDPEILKNYRPVANLSFISKIIEKSYGNPNT